MRGAQSRLITHARDIGSRVAKEPPSAPFESTAAFGVLYLFRTTEKKLETPRALEFYIRFQIRFPTIIWGLQLFVLGGLFGPSLNTPFAEISTQPRVNCFKAASAKK